MSTPSRSRTVLLYSVRFRRRAVTRPGSGGVSRRSAPARARARPRRPGADARPAAARRPGGISRSRSLRTTSSQRSRSIDERRDRCRTPRSSDRVLCFSLPWHVTQFSARNGLTMVSKPAAGESVGVAEGRVRRTCRACGKRRRGARGGALLGLQDGTNRCHRGQQHERDNRPHDLKGAARTHKTPAFGA